MLPGLDSRTDPPEASISHLLANKDEEIIKKEIINNFNFIDLQELHNLNDIDRSLLTSEGRSFIGKWLILEPKLIKQN